MKLNDKIYNTLKWVLFVFEPALITLISGFGQQFDWNVTAIVFVIGAIATFIGTITGISNIRYKKEAIDDKEM